MYNTITNNTIYTSGSICKENYSLSCDNMNFKTKKLSACKKNDFEIRFIVMLLILGNIFVLKKTSPSFNNFFGCFLQASLALSFGIITLKSVARKIAKLFR